MNARFSLLVIFFNFLLGSVVFAQTASFKCDLDRYKNSHNDNAEFNTLIDNACNEISLSNYQHARSLLAEAIRIDSIASNGIINSYIESQYRKLRRFIEENAATTITTANQGAEESKVEQSTIATEPEKQNSQTSENRQTETQVSSQTETTVTTNSTSETMEAVADAPKSVAPADEIAVEKKDETKSETALQTETTRTEEISEPIAAVAEPVAVAAPDEKKFTPEMTEDFHNKGMQKVKQLESFVYQIGSKSSPANIAMTSTENALKLFDSEERTVQVSSANTGTKNKYKIKTYLQRLRNLNYSDVKIEWADFQYASDFIKGSDGNYHGYIVFQQRFSATLENMNTYTDITTKKIEVILKFYEKAQQGELTENWDVLLGDVSVVQTEKN